MIRFQFRKNNDSNQIKLLFVIFLLIVFKTNITCASNYADTYGFSTTGISLGNAMVAHVDNWSSLYYNMAGLGKTPYSDYKGTKLEDAKLSHIAIDYLYATPRLDIDINRHDGDGSLPTKGDESLDSSVFLVGIVADINGRLLRMPEFISTFRLGAAIGVDSQTWVMRVNDTDPRTHNFLRYGREVERILLYSGIGVGFFDDFIGIGYGLYLNASLDGEALAEGIPLVLTDTVAPKSAVHLDGKAKFSSLFGLYVQPGKKWKKLDRLKLGFSYREESKVEVDPLQVIVTSDVADIRLTALITAIDFYQPNIITAGFSYLFGKKTILSIDYEIQQWSEYEYADEKVQYYGDILPEFDDISVARIGVQYQMSDKFTILGGYYYQPSFISDSDSSGQANFLDNDKHVFSIGLKYLSPKVLGFYKPFEITVGYQMQQLMDRDVDKTDPTGPNPNYSYGGESHALMIGIEY
jgi:long-chain fatty acid transport protein